MSVLLCMPASVAVGQVRVAFGDWRRCETDWAGCSPHHPGHTQLRNESSVAHKLSPAPGLALSAHHASCAFPAELPVGLSSYSRDRRPAGDPCTWRRSGCAARPHLYYLHLHLPLQAWCSTLMEG